MTAEDEQSGTEGGQRRDSRAGFGADCSGSRAASGKLKRRTKAEVRALVAEYQAGALYPDRAGKSGSGWINR